MSDDITLITALGSVSEIMPAALRFAPKKIILVTTFNSEENVDEKLNLIKKTFDTVIEVSDPVEVDEQDIYAIAKKIVAVIDTEHEASRKLIVNISGNSIYITSGLLFACFSRECMVEKILVPQKNRELAEFPKLQYDLNDTRKELLAFLLENGPCVVKDIKIQPISKRKKLAKPTTIAYTYQQLGYMEQRGYVNSSEKGWNITLGGKLALLNAQDLDKIVAKYAPQTSLSPLIISSHGENYDSIYFNSAELHKQYAQLSIELKKSPKNAGLYEKRGLILLKLAQIDKSLKDYAKAISLKPDSLNAYHDRGVILSQHLGKHADAIKEFDKALAIKQDGTVYMSRSFAHLMLGQYVESIDDCNKALSIDANDWRAYNNLGYAHFCQNKYQDAITDYNKAISLNPNIIGSAFFYRGKSKFNLALYRESIEDLDKAIERIPNEINVYFLRGKSYSQIKNYLAAISDYSKVLEINRNHAEALFERAQAYYFSQRTERAIADLEILRALSPALAATLEHLIKRK